MDITDRKTAEIGNLNVDDLGHLLQDTDHELLMEVLIDRLRNIGENTPDSYGGLRLAAANQIQEILNSFDE